MPKRVTKLKEGLARLMRSGKIVSQLEEWLREELDMEGLRIRSIKGCDAEIYGGMIPTSSTMYYCFKKGKVSQNYCKDSES